MNRAEAISKARKLLELSNSENEHEASLAFSLAQRVMAEHELTAAQLGDLPPDEDEPCRQDDEPILLSGDRWQSILCHRVAQINGCKTYRSEFEEIIIIGRRTNVEQVRYLCRWLAREVTALAKKQKGKGRTFLESYRQGVVSSICDAVAADQAAFAAEHSGSALVAVDKALARLKDRTAEAAAWARANLQLTTLSSRSVSADAFNQGRQDGKGIYGAKTAQLPQGPKRIG